MSLQDELHVTCPSCGGDVIFTEAGNGDEYWPNDVPPKLAGSLHMSKKTCPNCDYNITLRAQFLLTAGPC
jgi:ssDNA-binding Zn-finger/Zn-ribbon topoisomerase 1